ncbi:hypothetical protein FDP41_008645 [Naegleria fowleri]|uniref:Mitofilin n=1 Tax=Naegleria fowleri TaxID=5763 RepID=A0A6A5BEQ5_NAEFO|nr:uncharacterized protein FDP41_008645 [Naegleria fowleri]KAF0972981.1 hypothetical protein FDP41_008645 [Naegleria fowleri]
MKRAIASRQVVLTLATAPSSGGRNHLLAKTSSSAKTCSSGFHHHQQNQYAMFSTSCFTKATASTSGNNSNNTSSSGTTTSPSSSSNPTTTTKATESIKYNKENQLRPPSEAGSGGSKKSPSLLFKLLLSLSVISAGSLAVLMYLKDDIEKARKLEKEISELKAYQKQALSDLNAANRDNMEGENNSEKEEKIQEFNNKANEERSALENALQTELQNTQHRLQSIASQLEALHREKSSIVQQMTTLENSQTAIKKEVEQLNSEKQSLTAAIENAMTHSSVRVDSSKLASKEGPLSVEDRDLLILRIQQIEKQLATKDQLLRTLEHEYETKLNRVRALSEEQTKLEMDKLSAKLSEKQTELQLLRERLSQELSAEKLRLSSEMEQSLKEQAQDISSLYSSHAQKKDLQVREAEAKLKQLEKHFAESIDYFNDSLKLQQYTTAIISFQDATLNKKQPCKKEVEKLKTLAENDDLVTTALALIPEQVILEGAASSEDLRNRFLTVKKQALASSLTPSHAGLFGYVTSKLASVFVVEEHGLVSGESVNAALARAEYYLKHRRLENALSEIVNICQQKDNENLKFVLTDWMKDANDRVLLDQALRMLQSHLVVLSQSVQ